MENLYKRKVAMISEQINMLTIDASVHEDQDSYLSALEHLAKTLEDQAEKVRHTITLEKLEN